MTSFFGTSTSIVDAHSRGDLWRFLLIALRFSGKKDDCRRVESELFSDSRTGSDENAAMQIRELRRRRRRTTTHQRSEDNLKLFMAPRG